VRVLGLCGSVGAAARLWRGLRRVPGIDARFLISGSSPWHQARALSGRDLPAALRLAVSGRLRVTRRPLDDPETIARLRRLAPDVGLHATGLIYRRPVLDCFRLGVLNPHIGLLPRYRGRSVMEWSILEGHPTGVSVFFVDEGIDTGPDIVLRREIAVGGFGDVLSAKTHLFSLDAALFAEALGRLRDPGFAPLRNREGGRRYYVMSRLFTGIVDAILDAGARRG
jgi:methionyl-tRNA formyltransferase